MDDDTSQSGRMELVHLVASNGLQLPLVAVFGPTTFRNEVTWKRT